MSNSIPERWLPVVGYEGYYEVSDQGRVRSLDRTEQCGLSVRRRSGRILAVRLRSGYLSLTVCRDGQNREVTVHRLVAAAFIGPLPDGQQVRHLNGNRTDNRAVNLLYGTQSENEQDKLRHGRNVNAAKTHCKWGHEFTPENTVRVPNGRACRACRNEWNLRRRLQRKVLADAA